MDKIFIYIFTVWTVIFWVPALRGVEAKDLEIGLAIRQGEPARVVAQKNGELVLNCSVEYDSDLGSLTLSWTKDGVPVEFDRRVQKLQNGSLYIRRIIHRPKKNWTDEGRYKCFATIQNDNEQIGRAIAHDVQVDIAGMERKFVIGPQPQSVPEGGVARFQCKIQAVPPAMYEWQREKTALPQNDRYLVLNSGILQITGVTESDAGLYRCYATQGSLHELPGHDIEIKYSDEAELTVIPVPVGNEVKIVSSTKNTTALVRSPALLECLVEGFAGQVEWRKAGERVLIQESSRVERLGNNLRFVETELSDSGTYECIAGNVRASMTLTVIKKPVILEITPGQLFPRAQWIYLVCRADGHPKPTVTWLKDGEVIDFNKKLNYRLQKSKDFQLVITLSQPEDSGFFQCVASNEAGSVSALTRVKVFEQADSPKMPTNLTAVKITPTSILMTWQPAKAAMNSKILAYTVHYSRDGGTREEFVTTKTEISLEPLEPFSEYTIYVAAYSSAGQGPASQKLVVRTGEDKPSRAPVITLEPEMRAVQVKWEPLPQKYCNGIITGHKIFVRKKGSSSSDRVESGITAAATSYLITGLEPNTEYEVRMLSGTSVGYPDTLSEEQWPWVSVRTLSGSYVFAPKILITPINSTAINVSWSYADTSAIKHFIVQLQLIPSGKILKTDTLPAHSRHLVFSQLDETSVYEITLVVHTLDGLQSEAVEEYSSANIPKPPGPQNLQVVNKTPNSISIMWEESKSDMEVTSFTVRYRQTGTASYRYINSDTNTVLLEDLKSLTEYEISVRANAETTVSEYSEKLLLYTKSGVSSEPLGVQIQTIKPGKVRIQWQPPAQPNGHIRSYTILYTSMPSESEDLWVKVEKNSTETFAQIAITDMSGTNYYFKLRANTELGAGKPTELLSVDPSVPAESGRSENSSKPEDQKLGIIIGISIGVFCIIICFIIILLRHRCFGNANTQQPQTQPARFHGNGHIPGNGNGHAVHLHENREIAAGMLEMDAYTPMLHHLPENEQSDSKGGGDSNVILTANGAKLNGFTLKQNGIVNGQIQNGHVIVPSHYKEEQLDPEEKRGLIAAMLAGSHEPCMMADVTDDSYTRSRYEDLGSLDNIDTGSSEDVVLKTSGKEPEISGEDSGEGSLTASNRTSSEYGSSIPRSDTTDTGDTVVYCGSQNRDTGISCETYTSVRDRNDLPIDIPQSSPTCEDTHHAGGTSVQESRTVSGSVLPHDGDGTVMFSSPTIATSTSLSQAIRKTDNSRAGEPCRVTRNPSDNGVVPQVICNGSPPSVSSQSERRRHMATVNGVPPQMYAPSVVNGYPISNNGIPPQTYTASMVSRRPQGQIYGLSMAENNPSHSVTSREATYLVETPQELGRSTPVDPSPCNGHFNV